MTSTRGQLIRGIISGGQTGVDRAALDVAMQLAFPAGGWCPAGRLAEDGPLPATYPLRETISADPRERTGWNAFDSDATLILTRGSPSEGTDLADRIARHFERPLRRLEGGDEAELQGTREWLASLPGPTVLNIAGPRESEDPGIGRWARAVLHELLTPLAPRPADGFDGRPILVTGGYGYLGSHLLRWAPPGVRAAGIVRGLRADSPPSSSGHPQGAARTAQGELVRRPGEALGDELAPDAVGAGPFALDYPPILVPVELSDREAVRKCLAALGPGLVIHTAYSMTAGERDILDATRNVADATAEVGAELIHVSSDMVLDGIAAPFAESAPPKPVHQYGRWKAEAEEYVRTTHPRAAIVRASLLTSFDPPDPRTQWVLDGLFGDRDVRLFTDEIRTPILIDDIARQIWEISRLQPAKRAGVWNLAAPEAVSRYALGLMIAAAWDLDARMLVPALSGEAPGPRPRDLRLIVGRAERELLTRPRALSVEIEAARVRIRQRARRPTTGV